MDAAPSPSSLDPRERTVHSARFVSEDGPGRSAARRILTTERRQTIEWPAGRCSCCHHSLRSSPRPRLARPLGSFTLTIVRATPLDTLSLSVSAVSAEAEGRRILLVTINAAHSPLQLPRELRLAPTTPVAASQQGPAPFAGGSEAAQRSDAAAPSRFPPFRRLDLAPSRLARSTTKPRPRLADDARSSITAPRAARVPAFQHTLFVLALKPAIVLACANHIRLYTFAIAIHPCCTVRLLGRCTAVELICLCITARQPSECVPLLD